MFGVRVETTVPAVDEKHPIVNMNEPLIPQEDDAGEKREAKNCAGFEEGDFQVRFRPLIGGRCEDGE
jgi:hypothetical protein